MRVKLVSGGIDSYIMARQYKGKNIYIDFGQSYAKEEIKALKSLDLDFELINVNGKFFNPDIFIPNRNLCLASIVTMFYKPDEIYIAGLKDDNSIDKTPEAFVQISKVLTDFSRKKVEVKSPYWHLTKGELVASFRGDKNQLKNTFSCYNPKKGKPCYNCPACLRKIIALETNGIVCEDKLKMEILEKYLSKIHTYDLDRQSRFFIYLRKIGIKINAIDIDGTICIEKGNYNKREPIFSNIARVNKLRGINVLYTARLESDRKSTEEWLKRYNVKYKALIMNKLPYNILIDDRAER